MLYFTTDSNNTLYLLDRAIGLIIFYDSSFGTFVIVLVSSGLLDRFFKHDAQKLLNHHLLSVVAVKYYPLVPARGCRALTRWNNTLCVMGNAFHSAVRHRSGSIYADRRPRWRRHGRCYWRSAATRVDRWVQSAVIVGYHLRFDRE